MIVHSYIRFSSKQQKDGDSLRRQSQKAAEFCKKRKWTLSDLQFKDLGVSSFKGDKQDELKKLFRAIEDGRIKAGECVLFEAVDRLCRGGIEETRDRVSFLFRHGVHVALFSPSEKVYRADDSNNLGNQIEVLVAAYQGYAYSQQLSERMKAAYKGRREARANGKGGQVANGTPCWLTIDEHGRFVPKPDVVKVVKLIFRRHLEGKGGRQIIKELAGKYEPLSGRSNASWNATFISTLIRNRALLGEFTSTKPGESIKDYYPAIIDQKTFDEATRRLDRRVFKRRDADPVFNVFGGLLYHAVDRCGWHVKPNHANGKVYRRFISLKADNNTPGASRQTICAETLERMVFAILPKLQLTSTRRDPRAELENQQKHFQGEIDDIHDDIAAGVVAYRTVSAALKSCESKLAEIEAELASMPTTAVLPTKKVRQDLADMPRRTESQRKAVHERLSDVVTSIDIATVKLGSQKCSPVRAIVEILFANGEFRRCVQVDKENLAVVKGKTKQGERLRDQVKNGFEITPADYAKLCKLLAR